MDRGETKQSLVSPLLLSIENLTKFETEAEAQNVSGYPHVISVEETEKVGYSFVLKEDNFVAGDIVLWDGEKKIVASPKNFSLPVSGYTPIGIVVIPASHMGDNKARMMSLKWMSCDDPENGSIVSETMLWGTATEISGLNYYTEFPAIARYDDEGYGGKVELTVPQEIYAACNDIFLPSNYPGTKWTGETNPEDEGTRWCQSNTYLTENESGETVLGAHNFYCPSPYASDGTPNPLYRATSYSGGSINNVLSYFDGRQQTDAILAARGAKDYGSWKPDDEVPSDFPAASVCDMYRTVGTNQGDWYLPSQAELGYIAARVNDINCSLGKLGGLQSLLFDTAIWSSSVQNSVYAGNVGFSDGHLLIFRSREITPNSVIAFATV